MNEVDEVDEDGVDEEVVDEDVDDDDDDDDDDGHDDDGGDDDMEEVDVQNASDSQVKVILKLAMMAGSQKKEAVGLMKNLIGISKEQEKYVFDVLARMAKTPKAKNPYKRGRPPGQTNREGHSAGRPSNASRKANAEAASALFSARAVRQRTGSGSSAAATAAAASTDQHQAAEATQAAAAAKEKKRYDRAIAKIERYVASVPNGSFTSTVPTVDDDDEGLDLDVDSDDEGGEGEEDGAPAKRKR